MSGHRAPERVPFLYLLFLVLFSDDSYEFLHEGIQQKTVLFPADGLPDLPDPVHPSGGIHRSPGACSEHPEEPAAVKGKRLALGQEQKNSRSHPSTPYRARPVHIHDTLHHIQCS